VDDARRVESGRSIHDRNGHRCGDGISGPLLGNDAAIQLPAPIFCASATGVGAANEIATAFAVGVGVGAPIGVEPPPQPVKMTSKVITSKEETAATSLADRVI
jgi:hypothetical protein